MKKLLPGLLILLSISLQSQHLPNKFNIGDYIEIMENDSLLIYFNCTGTVVDKRCAHYYRKGKMDSININLSGDFVDYYMNGTIALKACIINDYLYGKATYYYDHGVVKCSGSYKQDVKNGVWNYYYRNGQLEKVINFVQGYPFIVDYYKKNGNQKVINGNGEYKGECYAYKACDPYEISGTVKNGKPDGEWALYNSYFNIEMGTEFYKDGAFLKGVSGNFSYTENPKVYINGFCANENLRLDINSFGCPGDEGVIWLNYKGKSLHEAFYPDLLDSTIILQSNKLNNQWLVIGLGINKNNELHIVHVKSSIDDEFIEANIYKILDSMTDFEALKMGGKNVDSDLFFTILIRDNKVIIPTLNNYRNE